MLVDCKCCSHFRKNLAVPQKVSHTIIIWPINPILIISKRIETSVYTKVYMNVHSNIIHNNQKMEMTQIYIDNWINKIYPENWILYSHKIEWKYWYMVYHGQILKAFCYMKEARHKRLLLYDSIYMNRQIHRYGKISDFQ